jgi:hypothetical protein
MESKQMKLVKKNDIVVTRLETNKGVFLYYHSDNRVEAYNPEMDDFLQIDNDEVAEQVRELSTTA